MLSTRPVSEGRAKERIGGAIDEFLELLFLESEIGKLKKRKWKLSEVDENWVERDFTGKEWVSGENENLRGVGIECVERMK